MREALYKRLIAPLEQLGAEEPVKAVHLRNVLSTLATVLVDGPVEVGPATPARETPVEAGVSPTADQNADDAIASIGNMRSKDKLQAIIDHDSRVTVQEAARRRLEAL